MDGNIEKMQSLTGRIKGLGIDKTLTKKGMCAEAEATGKALATKVSITDIVDDFLSVATDKPLSANQGRLLKKQIDDIDPHYAENVIYGDTNVKDALDEVTNELILEEVVTGTTDSYGSLVLQNIPLNCIPISGIVTNLSRVKCLFFIANNYHHVQIINYDATNSNCKDTSIKLKVYYINPNIKSHTHS